MFWFSRWLKLMQWLYIVYMEAYILPKNNHNTNNPNTVQRLTMKREVDNVAGLEYNSLDYPHLVYLLWYVLTSWCTVLLTCLLLYFMYDEVKDPGLISCSYLICYPLAVKHIYHFLFEWLNTCPKRLLRIFLACRYRSWLLKMAFFLDRVPLHWLF